MGLYKAEIIRVFLFLLKALTCIFATNIIIDMKVDFQLQSEEGDTGTFIANGEWALLGMRGKT